ncbi:hypothetical protein [Sediminibacterium sp.]|uniref:hypothetical protein n=1 Tax=Sediminibacterium sp. TaxID=1917865 RepID=UPI003F6959DD
MTEKQLPITCQEIFDDLKAYFPNKHAKVILENSRRISLRRIYGVFSGNVTDPKKIFEIAEIGIEIMRENVDPEYANNRKLVLKSPN